MGTTAICNDKYVPLCNIYKYLPLVRIVSKGKNDSCKCWKKLLYVQSSCHFLCTDVLALYYLIMFSMYSSQKLFNHIRTTSISRSFRTCVAMPTGQVLRWHFLIIVQPRTISGAVEKPNSSPPSRAPITISRPTNHTRNHHYCTIKHNSMDLVTTKA